MTWSGDFRELSNKLNDLADGFAEGTEGRISGAGQDPETSEFISPDGFKPKQAIGTGIQDALENGIVPEAKRKSKPYVTAEATQSISSGSSAWNRHTLYATHDLVKYHEFGTSTKAEDPSQATIETYPNGKRGYRIPAPPDQYFAIPASDWDGPSYMVYEDGDGPDAVIFDYVVHPGVAGQGFMRDALRENLWLIEDRVADELDDLEIDI